MSLMLDNLSRVVSAIGRIGASPDDSDEVLFQKMVQNNVIALGVIPIELFVGMLLFFYQEYTTALMVLCFAVFSTTCLMSLGFLRRYFELFKFLQLSTGLFVPVFASVMLGGIVSSGFTLAWYMGALVVAFTVYPPRQALNWLFTFLLATIFCFLIQPWVRSTNNLPQWMVTALATINLLGLSSMIGAALYIFVSQRDEAYRLLRGEQEKSEGLLLNILPKDIAAILKNENRVIADHYDGASILFADVVNFTPLSATMTPTELVNLLNEVFSHFDLLVEKHGLEKIKTIGDCYMVASGVPRPRADHAQVLTQMALEMQTYVSSREFMGRKLAFRIGINSGAVVAGVIGRKKFIYDLWGDAVNTASRMESHGSGGVIQITRATYELIKDRFVCEPRGTVNVKGKGEMEVWSVKETR